jgi:hypothetical protein
MTFEQIRPVLAPMAVLCAIMMIVHLFRIKSKGASAWILSAAFGIAGLECFAIRERAPDWQMITLAVILFGLLVGDFVARSAKNEK